MKKKVTFKMGILGYILTDKKIRGIEPFVKQINDIGEAIESLPILIVGWDAAKAQSGYKSVIERKLGDSLFWTFKKTESRMDFEKDLKAFYEFIFSSFLDKITYKYVNPTAFTKSKIKKMLEYVNSADCKCIYLNNGMLYVPYNDCVVGLSLRICEFYGVNVNKIVSIISKSGKMVSDKDLSDKSIIKWLQNNRYAMACMVSYD